MQKSKRNGLMVQAGPLGNPEFVEGAISWNWSNIGNQAILNCYCATAPMTIEPGSVNYLDAETPIASFVNPLWVKTSFSYSKE